MNPVYIEAAALIVLAIALLWIAWKLGSTMALLLEPFRALSQMQEKVLDIQGQMQQKVIDMQGQLQREVVEMQGQMQQKVLEVQGKAIEAQKQAIESQKEATRALIEPYRALSDIQAKALEMQLQVVEAQKQAVTAHAEAAGTLRIVIQRTMEVSEQADRSARKLSAAHDLYKGKTAELDEARQAFVAELGNLNQVAGELAATKEIIAHTSGQVTGLEGEVQAHHKETLSHIDLLAANDTVDRLRQFMSDRLRELLLRDLSRAATAFPRRIRIDLLKSGMESVGKVDGGEFLGTLRSVKFQLVCEAGNCDKKGNHYLSDTVYEVKQASFFVGALRKLTGLTDPGLSVFDGINRFDEAIAQASAEGAKMVLNVTVKLGLPHTVAVIAVVGLEAGAGFYLDRLRSGVSKPEDVKDLWQLISRSDFVVRDIGGSAHAQLGQLIEKIDGDRNQAVFGGLTRILDPHRGYMWVCPMHAQEFIDTLRGISN